MEGTKICNWNLELETVQEKIAKKTKHKKKKGSRDRSSRSKNLMSEWILWVYVAECVSVRKTEPVINFCQTGIYLLELDQTWSNLLELDQTWSKWLLCAFLHGFELVNYYFPLPQKTNLLFEPIGTISLKYKTKKNILSYFAYCILSENTPYFILLCSSYIIIISHPPKKSPQKRPKTAKISSKFRQKNMMLADIINKNSFHIRKKVPILPNFFLTTNIHFCHE